MKMNILKLTSVLTIMLASVAFAAKSPTLVCGLTGKLVCKLTGKVLEKCCCTTKK